MELDKLKQAERDARRLVAQKKRAFGRAEAKYRAAERAWNEAHKAWREAERDWFQVALKLPPEEVQNLRVFLDLK